MAEMTKNAIADAYLALAETKPIDKITVKDVVERCGITRQTFYYHFQDLLDVVEWRLDQYMEVLLTRTLAAGSSKEAMRVLTETVVETPKVFDQLMHSRRREEAERIFYSAVRTFMAELVRESPFTTKVKYASDLETALTFYTCAIVGVLIENSHKPNPDPELLADQLDRLVRGELIPE